MIAPVHPLPIEIDGSAGGSISYAVAEAVAAILLDAVDRLAAEQAAGGEV